jgi:hypothetical protein
MVMRMVMTRMVTMTMMRITMADATVGMTMKATIWRRRWWDDSGAEVEWLVSFCARLDWKRGLDSVIGLKNNSAREEEGTGRTALVQEGLYL